MLGLLTFFVNRIEVENSSMVPTYVPGERLSVVRPWRRVRPGDVVVVRDPRDPSRWLLKRCVSRDGRLLELRGDNPGGSTDSRHFGPVSARAVKWIVVSPKVV
ncbi:MAG: S26 family signal peptidase [Acidimicrobiales bacterium]